MRHFLIILSIIFSGSVSASDAPAPHRERVEHVMGEDRILAGERALASASVAGDLIIAGGEVIVVTPVGGDLLAAGGDVRVDADAGQDLYTAGGRVALNAKVKRNARIAGGKLEIGSQADIAGNATLAGGEVTVLGDVQGQLAVAGGRIYLNGHVTGNVDASGGEIELGPQARIDGNLTYRSPVELKRSPGADVRGTIVREPGDMPWGEQASEGLRIVSALLLIWTLGLMIVAVAFMAALPKFTVRMVDMARARPGMILLLGFVVLVTVPAAALLLLITGIGIPLALLLMAGYLATLMLGYVSAGVVLGQMGLRRLGAARSEKPGWRMASASLALLILTLLAAIPVLGWLVWFVALTGGIGVLLLQLRSALKTP